MSPFPDGAALAGRFADFDALAAATAQWSLRFSQIGSGPFSGAIAVASTAAVQIAWESWSTAMLVEGAHPPGTVSVALLASAPAGVRWNGAAVEPGTTLFGGRPGHGVNLVSLGPAEIVAISIGQELFDREYAARFGEPDAAAPLDLCLRTAPGAPGVPDRARAIAALRAVLAEGGAPTPAARRRLQDCVLQILLEGLETRQDAAPSPARRRIARLAEDALRARLDDPPSLGDLCALTGASERSLHLAFAESLGHPPKRYLRMLRLNAARRRLRRGEGSVTDIAAELGFFHFARFSAEYRALFGELPSQSLRDGRAAVSSGARPGRDRAGSSRTADRPASPLR